MGFRNGIDGGAVKKGSSIGAFDLLQRGMKSQFIEYANATKGKRSLLYSKGLKDKYNIGVKTDIELIEEEDNISREILSIGPVAWSIILSDRLRGQLIRTCNDSEGDPEVVADWLLSHQVYV